MLEKADQKDREDVLIMTAQDPKHQIHTGRNLPQPSGLRLMAVQRCPGYSPAHSSRMEEARWDSVHRDAQLSSWDSIQKHLCHIWIRRLQFQMGDNS